MTTYYVNQSSSQASDSNASTSRQAPFASLAAISNRAFQPGDVISIKAGTSYSGTLDISADGTAWAPITFDSYGAGAKPVIQTSGINNIALHDADYIILDGLDLSGASRGGVMVDATSDHNVLRNMEISNSGIGIEVFGQYNQILTNFVHDLNMVINTPRRRR